MSDSEDKVVMPSMGEIGNVPDLPYQSVGPVMPGLFCESLGLWRADEPKTKLMEAVSSVAIPEDEAARINDFLRETATRFAEHLGREAGLTDEQKDTAMQYIMGQKSFRVGATIQALGRKTASETLGKENK